MRTRILFLSIALMASISLFGRRQEKIYYDKYWKGCSQSKAEFYRIVNYDKNGKPVGKIKDYFITGELQAEIDGALYIDINDDSKSKFTGYLRGYYKNGAKSFESFHDNFGNRKWGKNWYEDGTIEKEWKKENGTHTTFLYGQRREKIYYDKDWKGCSQSKAEFYRIVNYNKNGKPVGTIKDYFITGELQAVADGASYIDKNDDSKSKFTGYLRGYYKNGAKSFERLHDDFGNQKWGKDWYENGTLEKEWKEENGIYTKKQYAENGKLEKERKIANGIIHEKDFENGKLKKEFKIENGKIIIKEYYENGKVKTEITSLNDKIETYITYYESGKLYQKYNFADGEHVDKFFLECDEFGKCQNVFNEYFKSSDNVNQWWTGEDKDVSAEILPEKGLFMKNKTGIVLKNTTNIPLELSDNFSIETIVDFKDGETNNGHGLIWGFKDWDNYTYFVINANGYYQISVKIEGIDFLIKKWTKSDAINQNKQRNTLKVIRIDDKIGFSINTKLVHSAKFYGFRGNNIGFMYSGKKELLFENLIVKQYVSNNSGSSTTNAANSNSEWIGNGSGFFIDRRGYIATNYHVIEDATQIEVNFMRNGQQQAFKAEVIQSDWQNDLAILKITDNSFKPFANIPYNFQTTLSDVGTNIFALGYPMAYIMGNEIKFTDGKISSKTGIQGDITMYQISVPIQSGNSGGALFDYDGNLVGITSAGLNRDYFNTENVNYAIKSSYLKNLIEVLPVSIQLPKDKTIAKKTLTKKIEILSDYVVLIKIK